MDKVIEKELSFAKLSVQFQSLGNDYLITVRGGDMPHIGCTVLALPRPSLTGDGSVSVTSSVINVTGHKDEEICRRLAEKLAKEKNAVTVCVGGFHVDGIDYTQIGEVIKAVGEIEDIIGNDR